MVDDILEPAHTLEYRIKNLEIFINILKEEIAGLRKDYDSLQLEVLHLRELIFD